MTTIHPYDALLIEAAGLRARVAELEAELARLRSGGCARDQGTTQWCAEAASAELEQTRSIP